MNIGVLSFWHVHAEGYVQEIIERTDCNVVGIWDEDVDRGIGYANQFGVMYYQNYDMLLNNKDIEGVIITSATSEHKKLIVAAIKAGKKVFSEKVLALTSKDCMEIKDALEKYQGELTLSLVKKCNPEYLYAKQMVESGKLGRITFARMRNVHGGSIDNWLPSHFYSKEQCGGGAMMDLGAHPMYLLHWILGTAKTVQSVFTNITGREVEDNAVSIMEFDNGIIGISETGFVSKYDQSSFEISGTEGAILIRDGVFYSGKESNGAWVKVEELPEALPSPLIQWATGVKSAEYVDFGIEDSIMLTRMMEAAYQSQNTGMKVKIEEGV